MHCSTIQLLTLLLTCRSLDYLNYCMSVLLGCRESFLLSSSLKVTLARHKTEGKISNQGIHCSFFNIAYFPFSAFLVSSLSQQNGEFMNL